MNARPHLIRTRSIACQRMRNQRHCAGSLDQLRKYGLVSEADQQEKSDSIRKHLPKSARTLERISARSRSASLRREEVSRAARIQTNAAAASLR